MLISNIPAKAAPVSREENFAEKLSALPGIYIKNVFIIILYKYGLPGNVLLTCLLFLDIQLLGPLFRSSEVVELTESETEYVVRCVKHCYAKHAVLQFDCLNTLNDQLLENVRVQLDPSEGIVN